MNSEERLMAQEVHPKVELKQHSIWQNGQIPDPCVFVIFGATGDLTQRKLLPTLAHLFHDHPVPQPFSIVAFARRPMNHEQWRGMALDSINKYMPEDDKLDSRAQQEFVQHLYTVNPTSMTAKATRNSPLCSICSTRRKAPRAIAYSTWQRRPRPTPKSFINSAVQAWHARSTTMAMKNPVHASSLKNPSAAISPQPRCSTANLPASSARIKYTASITTWAKKRCRTCWPSASPTVSSSRSGTRNTSITCRLWSQRV